MNLPRILLMLFLVAGCSHEPGSMPQDLQKRASLLKPEMTGSDVKTFFSDYLLITNVNEVGHIELKNRDDIHKEAQMRDIEVTKLYGPNESYSSWMEFIPKKTYSYMESCKVFYDANQVIVGYYYQISGQW